MNILFLLIINTFSTLQPRKYIFTRVFRLSNELSPCLFSGLIFNSGAYLRLYKYVNNSWSREKGRIN